MCVYVYIYLSIYMRLTIAAILSSRSPFLTPFDKRDAADAAKVNTVYIYLINLSLSRSIYVSIHPSIYLFIHICIHLSIYIYLYILTYVSMSISIYI